MTELIRGAKSSAISGAGPTFARWIDSSIGKASCFCAPMSYTRRDGAVEDDFRTPDGLQSTPPVVRTTDGVVDGYAPKNIAVR